ncbi:MAG: hypothetical protein ABIH28_01475 [archaeon]
MKKEESALLNQLAVSLEETMKKMEKASKEENANEFNKLRKFFFKIQEKIIESSR